MQLFELKRSYELTWEDIPFVECPTFAHIHAFNALNAPQDMWTRVINIHEFSAAEFSGYDQLQHYSYAEERLRQMMQSGEYLSICRSGKPFVAAFTWKKNRDHPHQGEWADPQRHFWMNPSIIQLLSRISHRWHQRQTQAFMDEVMDLPYAIARVAEEEVLTAPRAVKSAVGKPLLGATVVVATTASALINNTVPDIEAEQPKPTYKVLKGKYGTLHDYGDYIVHHDIKKIIGSTSILSKLNSLHECYALGEGFGLSTTDKIVAGKSLTDFGGEIPDGTIFGTFVENSKGELVYPSSRTGITDVRPHFFVYDASNGGLAKDNSSVNVIHQYKSGLNPNIVFEDVIENNESKQKIYANHLRKYHAIKIDTKNP